jgi:hypothetical protein
VKERSLECDMFLVAALIEAAHHPAYLPETTRQFHCETIEAELRCSLAVAFFPLCEVDQRFFRSISAARPFRVLSAKIHYYSLSFSIFERTTLLSR